MKSSPKGSPWRAQANIPEQTQQQRSSLWSGKGKTAVVNNPGVKIASSPEELTKVMDGKRLFGLCYLPAH